MKSTCTMTGHVVGEGHVLLVWDTDLEDKAFVVAFTGVSGEIWLGMKNSSARENLVGCEP